MKSFVSPTCVCLFLALSACAASARGSALPPSQNLTLIDQNSQVSIDPASQSGVYSWIVDGESELHQQWFWYRIGATGGESPIDSLSAPSGGTLSANYASLTYSGTNGLKANVQYQLLGGANGSGVSDLLETITLTNTSAQSMDLHFFQYSDFDLGGTSADNYVKFINANAVDQFKFSDGNLEKLAETVNSVVPAANATEYQGDYYPNILVALNDATPTTLSNTPAVGGPALGPGDMTWAFEWDKTLPPGGQMIITKDKNIDLNVPVPEPASLALLVAGSFIGLWASRRRVSA